MRQITIEDIFLKVDDLHRAMTGNFVEPWSLLAVRVESLRVLLSYYFEQEAIKKNETTGGA